MNMFFSGSEEWVTQGAIFSTLRLLCGNTGHPVANPFPSVQSVLQCFYKMNRAVNPEKGIVIRNCSSKPV